MRIFFLGLILLGFEAIIREALLLDAWAPPLLTILALWLGQSNRLVSSILVVSALGIVADGMAGSPIGLHVIYLVTLVYIAAFVAKQVRLRGSVGDSLKGLVGGVLALLLMGLVIRFVPSTHVPEGRMGMLLVPWVTTTTVLCPLLFPFFERLDGLLRRRSDFERI